MPAKLLLDLCYVQERTFSKDFALLIRTFIAIFRKPLDAQSNLSTQWLLLLLVFLDFWDERATFRIGKTLVFFVTLARVILRHPAPVRPYRNSLKVIQYRDTRKGIPIGGCERCVP